MLFSLMPPLMLSTYIDPACVQKSPGQNTASPLKKIFSIPISFCLCFWNMLHPQQWFPIYCSSLPSLTSLTLTQQLQLFLPVFTGCCQYPTFPIPPTLASIPSCFQHLVHHPTLLQTQFRPHYSLTTYLPALSSTLTRSSAAPKFSIPSFSPHCTLSQNSFPPLNISFLLGSSLLLISIETTLPAFPTVYFLSFQCRPSQISPSSCRNSSRLS